MQASRLGTQPLILQPANPTARPPKGPWQRRRIGGGAIVAAPADDWLPPTLAAPARQIGKVASVVAIGWLPPLIFLITASRLTINFNEL